MTDSAVRPPKTLYEVPSWKNENENSVFIDIKTASVDMAVLIEMGGPFAAQKWMDMAENSHRVWHYVNSPEDGKHVYVHPFEPDLEGLNAIGGQCFMECKLGYRFDLHSHGSPGFWQEYKSMSFQERSSEISDFQDNIVSTLSQELTSSPPEDVTWN